MCDAVVYAKKLILPSDQANVLQSLHMAFAFSQTGVPTALFPGVNLRKAERAAAPASGARAREGERPGGAAGQGRDAFFQAWLASCGIRTVPEEWKVLNGGHKGLYSARFALRIAGALLRGPRSLFYARDIGEATLLSRLLPLAGKKRPVFIYEMHETLFLHHRDVEGRSDWRETWRKERAALAAADGLVVVNRAIADIVVPEFGFKGPVLEEPNGVNETVFRPVDLFSASAPWPRGDDAVSLVYIGNMHPGKGVQQLVGAMALLPERFRLTIIGRGGEAVLRELDTLINAVPKGRERIRMLGHLPQGELWEQCRGAHMSIVPQQEGGGYFSPLKLNESLALGLPTVCTPLDLFAGQREYVFSSRDASPEGLAEAIGALAGMPEEAKRLRDQGLEAAKRRTWKARAARILEFADTLR